MRTNTIFTNIYNGSNIYMNMNGRRHSLHINDTEQNKYYDVHIQYKTHRGYFVYKYS